MWEQGTLRMPLQSELVPLGTQLITPALAEAFHLPYQPPAAEPSSRDSIAARPQHYLPQSFPPEQKPAVGFTRFATVNRTDPDRINSHAQASGITEPAGTVRGYNSAPYARPGGTDPRPVFIHQPVPQYHQRQHSIPGPTSRDTSSHPRHTQGGFGPYASSHPSWQDPAGTSKRTSQYTEPQKSVSAAPGSIDAGEDTFARALKRPRLVWTSQLHARFVEAVNQLGLKSAVPKTIMQLMGVEGLTRENVASHLQKYRLQLRKDGKEIVDGGTPGGPLGDTPRRTASDSEGAHDDEAEQDDNDDEHDDDNNRDEAGSRMHVADQGASRHMRAAEQEAYRSVSRPASAHLGPSAYRRQHSPQPAGNANRQFDPSGNMRQYDLPRHINNLGSDRKRTAIAPRTDASDHRQVDHMHLDESVRQQE